MQFESSSFKFFLLGTQELTMSERETSKHLKEGKKQRNGDQGAS